MTRRGRPFRSCAGLFSTVALSLVALGWSTSASAMPGGPPVSIVVASTANPSTFDQDVTYTATLTTSDSGSLDAFDSLEFQDNGGDISGCSSQPLASTATPGTYLATCDESGSNMSVGSHNITASFLGDSIYDQGVGSLSQTVNQAPTLTVITSPAPDSSVMYGNEGQNPSISRCQLQTCPTTPPRAVSLCMTASRVQIPICARGFLVEADPVNPAETATSITRR